MFQKSNRFSPHKQTMNKGSVFATLTSWFLVSCVVTFGCSHQPTSHDDTQIRKSHASVLESEKNEGSALKLSRSAEKVHRAVMREHLEAIHEIVSALAEGNFSKAEHITMTQLGFAKHRSAMRQQQPEMFPPIYHDLAMTHHEAAEELAHTMPSHDLKEILPHLERTLRACVVCHQAFEP